MTVANSKGADQGGLITASGVTLSYDVFGQGPPLVLVHGSLTDHRTNWQFVSESFAQNFTIYALARRGRGDTDPSENHSVEDEAADVVALLEFIGAPVVLLGHSYGAHVALAVARVVPKLVKELVLYEPPLPDILTDSVMARLEDHAAAAEWDRFTNTFFHEVLGLTQDDLAEMRDTPLWPQIVSDAPSTLHDLRAMRRYKFDPHRFAELGRPVTLQIGSESHRALYATDELLAVLPDARVQELPGQEHDAMLTAPEIYASETLRHVRS